MFNSKMQRARTDMRPMARRALPTAEHIKARLPLYRGQLHELPLEDPENDHRHPLYQGHLDELPLEDGENDHGWGRYESTREIRLGVIMLAAQHVFPRPARLGPVLGGSAIVPSLVNGKTLTS